MFYISHTEEVNKNMTLLLLFFSEQDIASSDGYVEVSSSLMFFKGP